MMLIRYAFLTQMVLTMITLSLSEVEAVGGLLNALKGKGKSTATSSTHQSLEAAREARERTEGKMRSMVVTKSEQMKYPAEIKMGKGWKSHIPGFQDHKYKKLQIKKEKQDAHIGKLERETGTPEHHQPSSLHKSSGSASPGDRASSGKKSSSSISLNGGLSENHQQDRREDLLVQIAGEQGKPVRQGGRGIKTIIPNTKEAQYHSVNKKVVHAEHISSIPADKAAKGKAIDLGSSPTHSISKSDFSHSDHGSVDNKHKEELYAYQNSQSLPVNTGRPGHPSRPGISLVYSPARSEGKSLFGGSSVGSAKGKSIPKQNQLSPSGKKIERRIKNSRSSEHQEALRQVLTVGTGIHSSRKVYESKEKMEEIDAKLRGKNGSDRFSAIKKHIPGTHEHARAVAKNTYDKHFNRMQDLAHDVSVHAERGTMNPNVLSEISKHSDVLNQHRAMLKLEKHASPRPPRHFRSPQPRNSETMSRGQSSSALHSLGSPDNSGHRPDHVGSTSTI